MPSMIGQGVLRACFIISCKSWSIRIADALNAGRLPRQFTALVEQRVGPVEADVLAIEARDRQLQDELSGGVAVAQQPLTRYVRRASKEI